MIMKSTGEKIDRILNEIGYSEDDIQTEECRKLSTQNVIDILLNVDKKLELENKKYQSTETDKDIYDFDMEELQKWRDNNNYINQISGEIVITSHRKVFGKFIVFWKKTIRKFLRWFISPLIEQQNRVNGSLTASINALTNNDLVIRQFIQDFQNSKIDSKKTEEMDILKNELEKLKVQTEEMDILKNELEKLKVQIESTKLLKSDINKCNSHMVNLSQDIDMIKFWQYKQSPKKKNKDEKNMPKVKAEESIIRDRDTTDLVIQELSKFDYHAFENKFRGSREDIKDRQRIYLEYFMGSKNVIDIGCGRGEFIELLSDNEINSIGIDVYEDFVEYCKYKGLNSIKDDALNYLLKQDDGSIDGIFMSQVAEHLDIDYLINLVKISYKKLQKGKCFIAETPNPKTLSIFSNAFYMDPSHKSPVHPDTFKFILEQAGFKEIKIEFTELSKINYQLPLINSEYIKNQEEFNDGINLLSEMFFGSQDYAIIARK